MTCIATIRRFGDWRPLSRHASLVKANETRSAGNSVACPRNLPKRPIHRHHFHCQNILLLPFFLTVTLTAQTPEAAIRSLVENYVDARNSQNETKVKSLFTSDADQLVSSGEWRKGRDAVVKGSLASTQTTGGQRAITLESIRLISPDTAIADGRYELNGLAGNTTRKMWTTFVLKREGSVWKIAAIRNMLPAPPAPSRQP
jgi:uncharacterized protein (TIGR02246 family)